LQGSSRARFGLALTLGFGISTAVFLVMMFVGYLLFGTASQPLLLNNFARSQDPLASLARLAIGAAIVFAYPLMFAGLKKSLYSMLNLPAVSKGESITAEVKWKKTLACVGVVGVVAAIAMKCGEEDVSLVLGIVGSILGCFVAYVLPGYLSLLSLR
jgi:hypothetical protein